MRSALQIRYRCNMNIVSKKYKIQIYINIAYNYYVSKLLSLVGLIQFEIIDQYLYWYYYEFSRILLLE